MQLFAAANRIKELYRIPNSSFSSQAEVEIVWQKAVNDFERALENENDLIVLESCILADPDWILHVDGRLNLLEKAKALGISSKNFLIDYYGYRAAHLDPGEEQEDSISKLNLLIEV